MKNATGMEETVDAYTYVGHNGKGIVMTVLPPEYTDDILKPCIEPG